MVRGGGDNRTPNAPRARRPFVMLPTELLYDRGVSWPAKGLWAVLDDLCRAAAGAAVPQAQLASAYGASPRWTRDRARELEAAGWLDCHRRRHVIVYVPLRRARPHVDEQLQLGLETGTILPLSPAPDRNDPSDLAASGTHHHAREEAEPRRLPACGQCVNGWLEDEAGRPVEKCSRCHPAYAAPW